MKSKLQIRILLLIVTLILAHSVYPSGLQLNPTIINGDVMLCPDGTELLETQIYDTYQWYKNGTPISGATDQTYTVSTADVLSNFSVEVTLGNQTAMSPSIFVDGYVFIPPVVSIYGSGYWGHWEMCEYHELYFELLMPYNTNIQWFKDGQPIPGANSPVYEVSETGVYRAEGAPDTCPDYMQSSMPLSVIIHIPPKPVITQVQDTLFTSVYPGQWYAGNNPIAGATGEYYVPQSPGYYSFEYTDPNGCIKMSDRYYFTFSTLSIEIPRAEPEKPVISKKENHLHISGGEGYMYRIYNVQGADMLSGTITGEYLNISFLTDGFYIMHLQQNGNKVIHKFIK
jgi:hypothetical protein